MTEKHTSWPMVEAGRIRLEKLSPDAPVVFETGFGASGRPHIGTFAEVARTIMVQNAFRHLNPKRSSTLFAFCDDMDGLRGVPGNIPEPEMLRENIGKPVSRIPDPYHCCSSYAAHMEGELEAFLSRFGFEFELKSSAREYASGVFNDGLLRILENCDAIRNAILPTLKPENRERWSPFIPICQSCGRLYTTRVEGYESSAGTVAYRCDLTFGEGDGQVRGCGHCGKISVLDGNAKVGWKVDWALRWYTYRVCYEMYGKDLIESAKLSSRITRILGAEPPVGMVYEMFLNEEGSKISKKVGEGLSVDEWLRYAPIESLLYFLFLNPKKQKRLFFEVIPRSVDDYLGELRHCASLSEAARRDTVAWHLEQIGLDVAPYTGGINFSLILNLICAIGAGDPELLWDYVGRYDSNASANERIVREMIDGAGRYFADHIEPLKRYREPTAQERLWLNTLVSRLEAVEGEDEDDYQSLVFEVAREHNAEPKRFFRTLYEVLLGQERGPRFGTFVKLIGKARAIEMISNAAR